MCKRFEITDGIKYSALLGSHLQAVERGEGHVEVCPVFAMFLARHLSSEA